MGLYGNAARVDDQFVSFMNLLACGSIEVYNNNLLFYKFILTQ